MEGIFLGISSIVVCVVAWRRTDLRRPLVVYGLSYFVTTVIGAVIIGVGGIDFVDDLNWRLDLSYLTADDSLRYWAMLFLPFIVAPLVAVILSRNEDRQDDLGPAAIAGSSSMRPVAVLVPFALAIAYLGAIVAAKGYWTVIASLQNLGGDYDALMGLRSQIIEAFGTAFFGIVYAGLPAFCHCSLYMAVKSRRPTWWVVFGSVFVITALACLAMVSKALILILVIFTAVAMVELDVISWRIVGMAVAGSLVVLAVLQSFFTGEQLSIADTSSLLIFRMSVAFPYYVAIYPRVLPYLGVDFGLNVFGIGQPPQDNLEVFNFMYPSIHWIQGAAAAPAHLRALAQAGVPFAIGTLAIIGVMLYLVARLRRAVSGPLSFAMYMQSLVMLYYLTQVSLVESIESSYGLIWSFLSLAPAWLVNAVLDARHRHSRGDEYSVEERG